MKAGKRITNVLMVAAGVLGVTVASATAAIIFTEDFEFPPTGKVESGFRIFDNPVFADVIGGGTVGNIYDSGAYSGSKRIDLASNNKIGASLLFEVASSNTLINGTTLTVSLYTRSVYSATVHETFDVIVTGGAVGTQSDIADSAVGVWQQHTFEFKVTDPTQAVSLKILTTRASSGFEDFGLDLITVDAAPPAGTVIFLR